MPDTRATDPFFPGDTIAYGDRQGTVEDSFRHRSTGEVTVLWVAPLKPCRYSRVRVKVGGASLLAGGFVRRIWERHTAKEAEACGRELARVVRCLRFPVAHLRDSVAGAARAAGFTTMQEIAAYARGFLDGWQGNV